MSGAPRTGLPQATRRFARAWWWASLLAPFALAVFVVTGGLGGSAGFGAGAIAGVAGMVVLVLFPGTGVLALPALNALRQIATFVENLTPAVPVAILACGAIVLHRSIAGRSLLHRSRMHTAVALLVVYCCIMAPIQLDRGSDALVAIRGFLAMGVIYYLFSEWADDARKVRFLAMATIAGGAIPMAGAVQHLVTLGVLGAAIRATALVENANVGAFFLNTASPFAVAFALDAKLRWQRGLWWGLVGLFAIGIFSTLSRTGLAVLVIAGSTTVALATGRARLAWFALGVVAVGATVGALLFSRLPGATEDVATLLARSPSERLVLAKVGWRMFRDHPLAGVGPDQYRFNYVRYLSPEEFTDAKQYFESQTNLSILEIDVPAHNAYILCFTEEGLMGGLLFLSVVIGIISLAYRSLCRFRLSGDPWGIRLSSAMVASLIAMALSLMTIDLFNEKLVWQLVGIAVAIARLSEQTATRELKA